MDGSAFAKAFGDAWLASLIIIGLIALVIGGFG